MFLNCFHCIMQYHQFQNYTIIACDTYCLMAFKFEGKEIYRIFVFAKCCWSIHSKVATLGKNAHNKQNRSHYHTKSSVPHRICVRALLVPEWNISAMKCEMCFPLECPRSAKVRTTVAKRVGARFRLALVPIDCPLESFFYIALLC